MGSFHGATACSALSNNNINSISISMFEELYKVIDEIDIKILIK